MRRRRGDWHENACQRNPTWFNFASPKLYDSYMWRYWLGTKFLLYFVALYEIHLILIAMNLPLTYYVDYDEETKILKLIMRVDCVNCLIWRTYIMGSIKQVFRCRMCELVNVEFIWRWIVMRLGCMRMGICVSILFFFYNPSSRLAKLKCTQNPDWNDRILTEMKKLVCTMCYVPSACCSCFNLDGIYVRPLQWMWQLQGMTVHHCISVL